MHAYGMGHAMLRTLRQSGGRAISVSDEDIRIEFERLGALDTCANYEGAARAAEVIQDTSVVMLINTSNHVVGVSG